MSMISSLCALKVEMVEVLNLEVKIQQAQCISKLALEPSYFSGDNIDQFEFLVRLLIHLNVLDPERDVEQWLIIIREYCNTQRYILILLIYSFIYWFIDIFIDLLIYWCNYLFIEYILIYYSFNSGKLTRDDILTFAESYRRKILNVNYPSPLQTTSTGLTKIGSMLGSPKEQIQQIPSVSSLSNIVSSISSPSHSYIADSLLQIDEKERTPLLPIGQPPIEINNPHQISESPLTLGKKNSYGLFLPHSYISPAPVQQMIGNLTYDEESSL